MKNIKKILLSLLVILSSSLLVSALEISDSYEKDLKYLLKIDGTEASYHQSMQAMFTYLKEQESNVPKDYWTKAEHEFLNSSITNLVTMLTPIYKRNLDHNDILALIQFYESEAGKRIAKKIPVISAESMQIGMQWGKEIAEKIQTDIKSKGFKIRLPFKP